MFGYLIYYSYLCITESVITPTGGEPSGGRVDSTALYIYIYPPGLIVFEGDINVGHKNYRRFFTNIIITLRVYFFYLILLLNNPPFC